MIMNVILYLYTFVEDFVSVVHYLLNNFFDCYLFDIIQNVGRSNIQADDMYVLKD